MRTCSLWIGLNALVALLLPWDLARADIQDALEDMFLVTGAEAGIYESQRRGGVTLGSFRVRAPLNRINLVNLTAPEIRAGCGGVDLYGGSFTMIDTEEFRQILRQIGANAIGYAFKLALATMCESCDKILTGLQDMMNKFTQMNVDTCQWAQGFVNDAVSAAGYAERVKGTEGGSASGMARDWFAAAREAFATPGGWLKNGDPSGADPANKNVGNITWKALTGAGVDGLFTYAPSNLSHKEVLMNIAGSLIISGPTDAEVAAGLEGDPTPPLQKKLSFTELKAGKVRAADGVADADPMWECDEEVACLRPRKLDGAWNFPGTTAWVREQLLAAANHMRDPVTAGSPHGAAAIQFLGSVPFNVTSHLVELQVSPGLDRYVEVAADAISAVYAVAFAESMVGAIEEAFSRTDAPPMPAQVRANIDTFKADTRAERLRVEREFGQTFMDLEELVAKLQVPNRNKPAVMSTEAAK